MSAQPDHPQHVRRVVLPGGRTVDIVSSGGLRPADAQLSPTDAELHICGSCASDLVYPIEWQEAGSTHWQVTLRCPNCEWAGTGVFEQAAVEAFDDQLERGTEALVRDLKRLVRANLEERVERFADALRHNLIVPDDF